jgi:hypothetical protein
MPIKFEMSGHRDQPPAKQPPRPRLDSLTEMPTHLITLSPAFLEALRKVAPTVRPRRLPYVLTFAIVMSIGVSIRVASGHRILLNHGEPAVVAPAPPVASATAAPKPVDPAVTPPSTLRPEVAATNAPGNATADPPIAPSTTISVGALPRATTPKRTKIRPSQATR